MAWVVDTSVVLDLVTGDPLFEPASIVCLQSRLGDGLVICPITFVELSPAFAGDDRATEAFLLQASLSTAEPWTHMDTVAAHRLWNAYQVRRKQALLPKRPVADVMIAAFALRFEGIISRNAADFRNIAPALRLVEP